MDSIWRFFSGEGFMSHGYCYAWDPWLVSLHLLSDTLIAVAYMSIPFTLIYFVRKRRDLAFSWMFMLFGVFIIACGFTHIMEIWTLWYASYWLSGAVKAVTAAASVPTAILLVQLIPKALAIPSPDALREEIAERKRVEMEVRKLNEELMERAAQLEATNSILQTRSMELQAANKELESFTYSVSHDLRAPLRHIDGFSKLLLREHSQEMSPRARDYLGFVSDGARQMGRLVDDLLHFARLGRAELNVQVTGLSALVENVVHEMKQAHPDRSIDWKVGKLPFVECDPVMTRQVFMNLLSNAVKFTRNVENATIEIGETPRDGRSVLFVRDNGVGFNMKNAAKLFGVFQRLHRQEDFEGTGIGLASIQRIIHKHGGQVWAEAELNHGATFYFTLADSVNGANQS